MRLVQKSCGHRLNLSRKLVHRLHEQSNSLSKKLGKDIVLCKKGLNCLMTKCCTKIREFDCARHTLAVSLTSFEEPFVTKGNSF